MPPFVVTKVSEHGSQQRADRQGQREARPRPASSPASPAITSSRPTTASSARSVSSRPPSRLAASRRRSSPSGSRTRTSRARCRTRRRSRAARSLRTATASKSPSSNELALSKGPALPGPSCVLRARSPHRQARTVPISRARPSAIRMIAPFAASIQNVDVFRSTSTLFTSPSRTTPVNAPSIRPRPPSSAMPPITAAAKTVKIRLFPGSPSPRRPGRRSSGRRSRRAHRPR